MVQFGTFIKDLAEKAGIDTTDKAFVDLLSANVSIPDHVSEKITQNLFNIDAAKQNSQLKGYFHAQALSVPDKSIEEVLEEMKFDDSVKAEFKNEKSTPAKIKKIAQAIEAKNAKLIDELKKSNGSEKSNERIDKLTAEITKLNQDLLNKDSEWQGKVKEIEQREADKSFNYAKKMALASKNYADEKRGDLNVEFADLVLQKELAAKKAKLVLQENGSFKLVQAENPDLAYMENHKEIQFGDFVDRTLANHNMLKVSAPIKTENAATITPANGKDLFPQQLREQIASNYDKQIAVFSNGVHA